MMFPSSHNFRPSSAFEPDLNPQAVNNLENQSETLMDWEIIVKIYPDFSLRLDRNRMVTDGIVIPRNSAEGQYA